MILMSCEYIYCVKYWVEVYRVFMFERWYIMIRIIYNSRKMLNLGILKINNFVLYLMKMIE